MGTPDFAVASLAKLIDNGWNVVGVVTAPDKPAGRGRQLQESAVKKYALEKGLRILQPTNLKSAEFQSELKSLEADIQVIVAFRMLPESVWSMPPLGSINLHGSLLPHYRGAAPINWAVINGEKETGVSTFFLQHEIDTGKIIFQEKTEIGDNDTAGIIHDKLMKIGADLVLKTIQAIDKGNYPQIPQDHITEIKHAPKIFKEDCKIDWNKTSLEIHNLIRGLSPYPAAWTMIDGKILKILESRIADCPSLLKQGELLATKNRIFAGTAHGCVEIIQLQLEGKKRMNADEFLRGHQISNSEIILG
jgi:methionyl-tRNA formyltransferase